MVNHKTDKVDMTTSGSEGNFNFSGLAAGEYELRVMAGGFAEYNVLQIVLQPNREFSQNITLKPGWVTEEVNVVAEEGQGPKSRAESASAESYKRRNF